MQTVETIAYRALAAVASQCDRAHSIDGTGFSKADYDFAHDMLAKGKKYGWTDRQHAAAKRMAHKYRRQASALVPGFDTDALAAEAAPVRAERGDKPAAPPVEFMGCALRETAKAYQIEVEVPGQTFGVRLWCPKSVIVEAFAAFGEAHEWGVIKLADWFARKEGLVARAA